MLIFSLNATAQDRPRDDDSQRRDARFHDEHWRGHLFEDVRQDVAHVRATTWPSGGDTYRLDDTIGALSQLQTKLAAT
jgi:hypothetical protein